MDANNTVLPVKLELDALVHDAVMRGLLRIQVELQVVDRYAKRGEPVPTAEQIDAAYARNVERWTQRANLDSEELYALHVARREDVYRRAHQLNEYKTCAGILKDLAQLEQQYRREQRERTAKTKADELRDRIKAKGHSLGIVK